MENNIKKLKASEKMPKARAMALANTLKRGFTVASIVGFGTFSGLVALHQVGSTTTTQSTQTSSGSSSTKSSSSSSSSSKNSSTYLNQLGGNTSGTSSSSTSSSSSSTVTGTHTS